MKSGKPSFAVRMALAVGAAYAGVKSLIPGLQGHDDAFAKMVKEVKSLPGNIYNMRHIHRQPTYRRRANQLRNMSIFALARYARRGQGNSATAELNRRLNNGEKYRQRFFNLARITKFNTWVRNAA